MREGEIERKSKENERGRKRERKRKENERGREREM